MSRPQREAQISPTGYKRGDSDHATKPVKMRRAIEEEAMLNANPTGRYGVAKAVADIVIGFQKTGSPGFALLALIAILITVLLIVVLPSGGIVGGLVRWIG